MAVVARFDHPFAVLLADDFSNVVIPDDDGSDARWPWAPPVRPISRNVIGYPRIRADEPAHLPAAPRRRPAVIKAPQHVFQAMAEAYSDVSRLDWLRLPSPSVCPILDRRWGMAMVAIMAMARMAAMMSQRRR